MRLIMPISNQKFALSLFLLIFSSINCLGQYDAKLVERIRLIIDETENSFAPDKRVAIFDVVLKTTSSGKLVLKGETDNFEAKKSLLKKIGGVQTPVLDSIEILPEEELQGKTYALVNLSVANMRTGKAFEAGMATQATLGTPLKVLKKEGWWYKVQTPDGYISWVSTPNICVKDKQEINDWLKSKKIVFLPNYGQTYAEPSDKSQPVSDIVAGSMLKYVSKKGRWYKVLYPDGREAYVRKKQVSFYDEWSKSALPTGNDIIKTAKRFMGLPYLWGGASSKGLDCSGFTRTVYYLHGIIIPRDASQQALIGESIDISNGWEKLKAGDLVLFGRINKDTGKERIWHVGLYISDGDFIHSGGILQINSFNPKKPYYSEYDSKIFVKAVRILNSVGSKEITKIKDHPFYLAK